jgi:hypothetical protein
LSVERAEEVEVGARVAAEEEVVEGVEGVEDQKAQEVVVEEAVGLLEPQEEQQRK